MTIPNVVLGELIDPVTFGNAVVDAVNEHETEISDRLPLSGGTVTGNLQVDGTTTFGGIVFANDRMIQDVDTLSSKYFRGRAGRVPGFPTYSFVEQAEAGFYLADAANKTVGMLGNLLVHGTITDVNGPVRSFAIADGIDTADVLDRAETATMPVVDDEGVATTDAEVESVTVNEVVTALLVKVKQLEERIEALEA